MGKYSMEIVELLREQLRVHEQNLAKLELQAARHGMDVPLPLQNQIDFETQKIEELRSRLSEAEAGLDVGEDALGLVAEKPVPLWRKVPMWAWVGVVVVVLLAVAALAFLAKQCAGPVPTPAKPPTTPATSQLESKRAAQITARGTIRIGVHESPGLWPLSICQGDSYSGFEIDLAQEIVKRLFDGQVSIEWVPLTAAERLLMLESGEIDFLIRNTTHTLSREAVGLWTSNYFLDGSRLLVRRGVGITGLGDLNGESVSVVAGTKWETDLYEAADTAGVQITTVSFKDYDATFAAFTEGRTDAFIYDWSVLLALSQGEPAYQVVGEILSSESLATSEPLAIGIPPNNPDFRNEVDEALQAIIADGTWQMFYDLWFPDPPPWTLEEMLAEPPPNR